MHAGICNPATQPVPDRGVGHVAIDSEPFRAQLAMAVRRRSREDNGKATDRAFSLGPNLAGTAATLTPDGARNEDRS
jgi:hypothetical protein